MHQLGEIAAIVARKWCELAVRAQKDAPKSLRSKALRLVADMA
jgi:hypothetical protein